ncbi:MAG: hypothetical protein EXR64_02200 [Dehalococcoidia bacterium]|nr:hypothetical protein [Dehalococcoidia bacterium]
MASIPRTTPPRTVPALPPTPGRNPLTPNARAIPAGWGVARRRISRFTLASFALLAVAALGLVQVLQTTKVAATGYQVSALEREQQDLDADIRLLEAQIAASSNLEQVQREATTRLGMTRPQARVRVSSDVPAPAIVPLPRRYIPAQTREAPLSVAWWERVLGVIPGMH